MNENQQYAIIKTGGKQYRVKKGQKLLVEKLAAETGKKITFDEVLFTSKGEFKGAPVKATVLAHTLSEKVTIFKKKRRKGYTKKQGHRQQLTEVMIDEVM